MINSHVYYPLCLYPIWDPTPTMTESETTDPDQPTEAEVVEVAEEKNPALTAEVEALSTFSEQEGPLSFRIIPIIAGGQTDWRLIVYMNGTQGPIYQSRDGLTDAATQQFGITSRLQTRINDALAYAKQELHIPEGLGDQKREKRTLHELELMMDE